MQLVQPILSPNYPSYLGLSQFSEGDTTQYYL